jgi:serine/threonine protein phosphatase PrpC
MRAESQISSSDERFMSKSFGGGSSPLIAKANLDRHTSSDLSNVSYSGYLLKRSNQQWDPESSKFIPTLSNDPLDVPGLPMMPGVLSPEKLDEKFPDSEQNRSQATAKEPFPLQTYSVTPPSPPRDTAKSPIELGLESAAAFFGMSLGHEYNAETTTEQMPSHEQGSIQRQLADSAIPPPKKASAPIKVGNATSRGNSPRDRIGSQQNSFGYNRQHSAPDLLAPNSENDTIVLDSPQSPLHDFQDSDGHLWRSKYCVLEEGVLYFYRNPSDAESAEAVQERRLASRKEESQDRKSSNSYSAKDLSKSPMPRGSYHHLDSAGSGESSGCIWEKRVLLNSVGSVRSAEKEYGTHAFQLEAIDDDEDHENIDTLVLRARNQDDMKEWIFQFHRSLSLFMRNIMNAGIYLDIAHPALSHQPSSILHNSPSEKQLQRLLSMSPKFVKTPLLPNSLSHGHGRITLHRRRQDIRKSTASENGTSSLSSTPETGGSSLHQRPSTTISAFRMSPVKISPPERFLFPPVRQKEKQELESEPNATLKYVPPFLRKENERSEKPQSMKYVPPSLRKKQGDDVNTHNRSESTSVGQSTQNESLLSLAQRAEKITPDTKTENSSNGNFEVTDDNSNGHLDVVGHQTTPFQRGGCADPQVVEGSIMDPTYIPRKASRLGPTSTEPFGCFGGGELEGKPEYKSSLRWEIGAVSECGIRNSNEDAYLIANDLLDALRSLHLPQESSNSPQPWNIEGVDHHVGLFAVFDGHCGDQAARFAAEKLEHFIFDEIRAKLEQGSKFDSTCADETPQPSLLDPREVEFILHEAMTKMDDTFCRLCQEGGREWESGSTALVVVIANENLVVANLGDCRGLLCRFVKDKDPYVADDDWNELDTVIDDHGRRSNEAIDGESNCCFWKEMTNIHSPAAEQERIELANGWVTTETEIPIGQLRRIDFLDEDVIGILKRCFNEPSEDSEKSSKECKAAPQRILEISRVCGELAVSRALGDRDFKAAFNLPSPITQVYQDKNECWDCPLFLPYPDVHDRCFRGDLVSNTPDFQRIRVGEDGVSEEFLLLACDGLWDVLDADDAVRVTRDLLFRKRFTAKRAVRNRRRSIHNCS